MINELSDIQNEYNLIRKGVLFVIVLVITLSSLSAQTINATQWLRQQPLPVFKPGYTLPKLDQLFCGVVGAYPLGETRAELALNYGYAVNISSNPTLDAELRDLCIANPEIYKPSAAFHARVSSQAAYTCPGSAIYLHGNEHRIELNEIHHAATDGDDMGAVYYGRDPSEFGNRIKNNFFHHIGNNHGMILAVYHDDGACGMEVTGNTFYKAGSIAVMIGGGNDNTYTNNIFIDVPLAFCLDNRLQAWFKGFIEKGGIFEKRLNAVNYKQPPYSIAYPSLVNYFEVSPGLPKRNFIDNNVFLDVKLLHNGSPEWSYIGKCYIACGDPGFIDASKMNFELKPSSEIFKILRDFKAIPFSKIGKRNDKND